LPRGQKIEKLITRKNKQLIIATISQWVPSLDCEMVVLPIRKGEFVVFPKCEEDFLGPLWLLSLIAVVFAPYNKSARV
jgi:hypothetical protein